MSLKAGREGINSKYVDEFGNLRNLPGGSAVWGQITGTLAEQLDLKAALDAKQDTLTFDNTPTKNSPNVVKSGGVYDALGPKVSESLLDDTVGWVGKNEFDGKATTTTDQYGLTWTVDASDNNVITVSGTPTGFVAFNVHSTHILEAGDYTVSGISDAVNIAFNAIALFKNNHLVRMISEVGTDNQTITINANDDYDTIRIGLKRKSNNVACSGTIRLMIHKAEITDITYYPYHKSVEDTISDVYGVMGENGAKNKLKLVPASIPSGLYKGVTFTQIFDDYGNLIGFTADGTPSENFSVYYRYDAQGDLFLKPGESYILSTGNTSGSSDLFTSVSNYVDSTSSELVRIADDSPEKEFTVNSNATGLRVNTFFRQNKAVNNVTFKPMIRDARDTDSTYQPPAMTNAELTEKAFLIQNAISSSDDLNNIKKEGIYAITSAPTHSPEDMSYCIMIVKRYSGEQLIQIIHKHDVMYSRRYFSNQGTLEWSSWYKFTGTVVS